MKFEIIGESRIVLDRAADQSLHVPMLSTPDTFAEKLLANADRCIDRAVCYRDAIDLGHLLQHHGTIPGSALEKAVQSYGQGIERKAIWVVNKLLNPEELRYAAERLQMDQTAARVAIDCFRQECRRIWPDAKALSEFDGDV